MIVTQKCANLIIGLKYSNALCGGKDALKLRAACTKLSFIYTDNWESLYTAWDNGEITAKEFMDKSGLKKGTFYNLINEYKEILEINKNTMGVG